MTFSMCIYAILVFSRCYYFFIWNFLSNQMWLLILFQVVNFAFLILVILSYLSKGVFKFLPPKTHKRKNLKWSSILLHNLSLYIVLYECFIPTCAHCKTIKKIVQIGDVRNWCKGCNNLGKRIINLYMFSLTKQFYITSNSSSRLYS